MAEIKDCCSCIYANRSTFTEPCVSCGVDFQNYVAKPTPKRKRKTNADLIRAMTDEELDKFLGDVQWDVANYCGGVTQKQEYPIPEQRGAWFDWLKQEATQNEQRL